MSSGLIRRSALAIGAATVLAIMSLNGSSEIADRRRVDVPGSDGVEVELRVTRDHAGAADRFFEAAGLTLRRLAEWFGPHHSPRLTIVEVPWVSPEAGHALSPTRAAVSTRLFAPSGAMELERTTIRAVAEAYWRPSVASAAEWLLYDLAAYSADRIMPERFGAITQRPGHALPSVRYFGGFVPFVIRAAPLTSDLPSLDHGRWMATLERYVGWPATEAILAQFRDRSLRASLTLGELVEISEAITGRDLAWLFEQIVPGGPLFDYGVESVRIDARDGGGGRASYRSTAAVRRYGSGIFSGSSRPRIPPFEEGDAITIKLTFSDGESIVERWDGRDASKTIAYEGPAPLRSIEVDPDGILRIDRHRTNNSWTRAPQAARASTRWAARWLLWLEQCLITYAALA